MSPETLVVNPGQWNAQLGGLEVKSSAFLHMHISVFFL